MFKFVVLACVLAVASAGGLFAGIAPLGYSAPIAYSAPLLAPYNYRGPFSLAPGQPANVLAADGRPLDTLDVNLDRSAHFTAKALSGHLLKKRSAPIIAAPYSGLAVHSPVLARTVSTYPYPGVIAASPIGLGAVPYSAHYAGW